ncbi:uncharacterized protein [Eurosta solidaginis]|uniref:uncharacterized protein isoform X1 n=1 Tax=Eurosta solidaginis TaxID=178769 RepID=UPI003530FF4B
MDITTQMQQLSDEISQIRSDVQEIKGFMDHQGEVIDELLNGHKELMNRMVKHEKEAEEERNIQRPVFPIMTQEDLDNCEEFIGKDERKKEEMVRFLKPLLMPVGLKQKLIHVLSDNILMSYNLEGTHGKKRMLQYPKLLSVLYSATDRPGWSYNLFLDDLRRGFQYGKKKHFRLKCRLKSLKSLKSSKKVKKNPLSSGAEEEDDDDDDEDDADY